MIIYLSGSHLTEHHEKFCWSYYCVVDPTARYGAFADLKRFIKRKREDEKIHVGNIVPVKHIVR